jgi:hypothetical protein
MWPRSVWVGGKVGAAVCGSFCVSYLTQRGAYYDTLSGHRDFPARPAHPLGYESFSGRGLAWLSLEPGSPCPNCCRAAAATCKRSRALLMSAFVLEARILEWLLRFMSR